MRPERGGAQAERDAREALGRSRGGFGTKACVTAEGDGRAIGFAIAPGQAHELPLAPDLLARLPDIPGWVVGDRGLASHAFRQSVWDMDARPAIPAKRNEEPVACPPWIYNNRNRVERLWPDLNSAHAQLLENARINQTDGDLLCHDRLRFEKRKSYQWFAVS